MKKEYQIRSVNANDETDEECICFDSLAKAQAHYEAMLSDECPYEELEIELIEVLRQDTIYGNLQEE